MKRRDVKLFALVLVLAAMLCVATYAEKDNDVPLPDAVKNAIVKHYPQAVIQETEVEEEGLKVYEIELQQNGRDIEVTFASDGRILEVESEVAMDGLAEAVKAALTKAAAGGQIEEVSEEVTYWVLTLKKLKKPKTTYEAEVIKDGTEIEIEIAADGTILTREAEEGDDDDDEDDDDEDDDEDEQEVTFDQMPTAVRATIVKHSRGGTIEEIERETKNGKTIYEAEVTVNGKEIELKIAPDGTLLSKEVDDDD